MMETTGAGPDITAQMRGDSGAAIDPKPIEPAAKRVDTKDTPVLHPTTSNKPPDLSLPAAQAEGMTPQQLQHEQAAALAVTQAARQAAIDNDDEDALLDYSETDDLSADEADPWSPDAAVPNIFDGADAEENPDLLGIQSAESKVSSCIYDFIATAVPDKGLKITPGKKQTLADAPVFRFALVNSVQTMCGADARCKGARPMVQMLGC